jgi:hypothetical protein
VGRKVVLGMILAAVSAGAGGGVAIAATQGAAHPAKVHVSQTGKATAHHCHTAPAAVGAL